MSSSADHDTCPESGNQLFFGMLHRLRAASIANANRDVKPVDEASWLAEGTDNATSK